LKVKYQFSETIITDMLHLVIMQALP